MSPDQIANFLPSALLEKIWPGEEASLLSDSVYLSVWAHVMCPAPSGVWAHVTCPASSGVWCPFCQQCVISCVCQSVWVWSLYMSLYFPTCIVFPVHVLQSRGPVGTLGSIEVPLNFLNVCVHVTISLIFWPHLLLSLRCFYLIVGAMLLLCLSSNQTYSPERMHPQVVVICVRYSL